MSTSVPSKTAAQSIFSIQSCASGSMYKGTEINVAGMFLARAKIRIGRDVTTALTNYAGILFQTSPKVSGDDWWTTDQVITNGNLAVTGITASTVSGAHSAGGSTLTLSASTGMNAGDMVFIKDATPAYEFVRFKSVSGAVGTLLDNLVYAHANGTAVFDQAEEITVDLDFSAAKRFRMVVDTAAAGGQAAAAVGVALWVEAWMTSLDNISTT